jgi:hypothetical protein
MEIDETAVTIGTQGLGIGLSLTQITSVHTVTVWQPDVLSDMEGKIRGSLWRA